MQQFIVLWFKKDLRLADNAALCAAIERSRRNDTPVVALWITEPESYASPEFHIRRERFAYECLLELAPQLRALNIPLLICDGSAEMTFDYLAHEGLRAIFSHEETGLLWTFRRDQQIHTLCKQRSVEWFECPSNGVVRRLKSRDHWQGAYRARMQAAPLPRPVEPAAAAELSGLIETLLLRCPSSLKLHWWEHREASRLAQSAMACRLTQQLGGESVAAKLIDRFLQPQINSSYVRNISRPHDAQYYSSRLSPYLAHGCVSSREVISKILNSTALSGGLNRGLSAFQSRLAWRCHFIQKLENFPELESVEQNRALKNLRPALNERELECWQQGMTGVPLVDACLRSVHQTGFLNFRMRAMLMSFVTHLMWRDWREPAWDLARAFLDFEPGIHFAQVQMQAAVTGNNQIRIYNPLKQSAENDPETKFIKHWVPELRSVRAEDIHAISHLPSDYPSPIIDLEASLRFAREQLFQKFKAPDVRAEAKNVQKKLGSRGGPLSWRGRQSGKAGKARRRAEVEQGQPTLFSEE
jgi:deoxyribodipyrimidine photo-lyase